MAQKTGYLEIDHSNSPGLPEHIARLSGFDPALCGEGKKYKADTLRCAHCAVSVQKSPTRTKSAFPRASCQKCRNSAGEPRYVCDVCAFKMTQPDYTHMSYEKRINLHFDAAETGKALGKGLILPG